MQPDHLGPYRIVRPLGRGGMGAVYEGVNGETGESAAVKILAGSLAGEEGFRQRFEAEIEALRMLRHPNIVRLFGFGEQEGFLYYAMELVDGPSLEQELRNGRRFTWLETARIGIETCRALRHAHDRGIIHRDIKPANLLLTGCGPDQAFRLRHRPALRQLAPDDGGQRAGHGGVHGPRAGGRPAGRTSGGSV